MLGFIRGYSMLKSSPVRLLGHSLNWLARLTFMVSAVAAALIALAIIMLRYWLLPDIERYHDRITASLASAIGNPVTIGKIQADWQGLRPHLNFTDVRILDEQRQPALVLQSIDGSVAWMSLFSAELRLASLEIDKPELLIRRDAQGKFFIGGVLLSKSGDNHNLADWILHQSNMVMRNALIVWIDEQRNAPPLVLRQVNLRIDNLFTQHIFALRGIPPEELATPLDMRGEFYGDSFDNLAAWHGQLFTQLDYTDVTAWRPWLDLPSAFSRGRGALRGWLGIKEGRVVQVTADMDLRDMVTKLADDVPELVLPTLRGRAAWQEISGGFEVSTRQLTMRLQNGIEFPPTDFYFRTVNASNKQYPVNPVASSPIASAPIANRQFASGQLRANLLQLESLASLAKFLPMEADLRTRLDVYAPRGKVTNLEAQWQSSPDKSASYKVKGHFENLAVNQVDKAPGFSGLSLDVDGSEASGKLSINSHRLTVDAPGVMREPLSFASLIGQAGWQREHGELTITVDNITVANADLAGKLYGAYHTLADTKGVLDLNINLTHADIRRAARYTPLVALNKAGNDWLNGALLAGHSEDFHLRIKGNLSDFPLDGSKDTLLEIGGHAQDAVLEFDKHWPRIENISGELLIRGNKLEVKSSSATMSGTRVQNTTVTLPNMLSKDLSLEIKGEAVAPSNSFLEFIQNSPVRGYTGGFTDGIRASGNAHLDLFARVPLLGSKPVQVSGTIKVQGNDIDLGEGVPLLRNTRGTLQFTESGMQASDVSAEILGGTASINVQTTADGAVHAALKGRSNVDVLRKVQSHPLLNYLHGSAAWDADINVVKKSAQIIINSNLQGLSSSLPQPFFKRTDEIMRLHVEKNPLLIMPKRAVPGKACPAPCPPAENSFVEGQDVLSAQLGKLLSARLMRRNENGVMVIKRGVINFGGNSGTQDKSVEPKKVQELPSGKEGAPAELMAGNSNKTGVWVVGNVPVVSIQGWEGLTGGAEKASESADKPADESASPSASSVENPLAGSRKDSSRIAGYSAALPIVGINLHIEKLTGYGQSISALHIDAARRGDGLAAQLSSSTVNGEVVWEPHGYEKGSLFRAHLSNLHWPGDKSTVTSAESSVKAVQPEKVERAAIMSGLRPGNLPALDISVEDLQFKGKQFGHFELVGHPEGKDWRLRRVNISNPDTNLVGDGVWGSNTASQAQTQINLVMDISDAGKMLGRFGYPNTVQGGNGKLTANLSWAARPDEFSYAILNGTLQLDTDKGRFLKMNQGAGKLLSILSLQDLPKHISLGFTDVFSEGFQFDRISGSAVIKGGVIETQDFHIVGSSAKVNMKGTVDLKNETQNLSVRIFPSIGDSVSLIGLIAISPPVGIGLLLGNTLLGNPLDKIVAFEYKVSGTWNDPSVIRVGGFSDRSKKK